MSRTLILGVDPGLKGAACVLECADGNPSVLLLADLPVVRFSDGRVKNRLDGASLAQMLAPFAGDVRMAVVERVGARPGEAASGAFSFGYTSGVIAGALGALEIPITLVQPAVWKRAMGLASADKDAARARAIELFPVLASDLARKKDHDRAEAVLMAEHGRRTQL